MATQLGGHRLICQRGQAWTAVTVPCRAVPTTVTARRVVRSREMGRPIAAVSEAEAPAPPAPTVARDDTIAMLVGSSTPGKPSTYGKDLGRALHLMRAAPRHSVLMEILADDVARLDRAVSVLTLASNIFAEEQPTKVVEVRARLLRPKPAPGKEDQMLKAKVRLVALLKDGPMQPPLPLAPGQSPDSDLRVSSTTEAAALEKALMSRLKKQGTATLTGVGGAAVAIMLKGACQVRPVLAKTLNAGLVMYLSASESEEGKTLGKERRFTLRPTPLPTKPDVPAAAPESAEA